MPEQEVILSVKNLKARFGSITALKGVSLDVYKGEIVTIVGANGAGKTTLLSCISCLMPFEGEIIYEGVPFTKKMTSADCVEKGLIQVPEGRQIFSDLSVYENLLMGAYTRKKGDDISSDLKIIYDLFPRLYERKDQKGGSLSGGEQQMLAVGRALMSKPKLLMMDEPSMGLAPIIVEDIFRTIVRLNKELGVTIILIEQNARLALKTADRAYVLETGLIQLSGKASDLAKDPQVQKLYLGG